MDTPLPSAPVPNPTPVSWLTRYRRFIIIGAGVILLGGGAAVWLTTTTNPAGNSGTNSITNSSSTGANRTTFERFPVATAADQDGDGVPDSQEQRLGTNSKLADTDGDGLTDGDEVNVYQTDPKRQDTDGDGPPDGQEVKAGFNPRGAGPLLNLPQAIQDLPHQE